MSGSVAEFQCGTCGAPINEPQDISPDKRTPCSACGSTIRHINVSVTETASLHESLKFKHKNASGESLAEGLSGDDLHRNSGRWMQKERLIDWGNDRYREVVTDPETGIIVHHCEEPLSKHRGHGSAKKTKLKKK